MAPRGMRRAVRVWQNVETDACVCITVRPQHRRRQEAVGWCPRQWGTLRALLPLCLMRLLGLLLHSVLSAAWESAWVSAPSTGLVRSPLAFLTSPSCPSWAFCCGLQVCWELSPSALLPSLPLAHATSVGHPPTWEVPPHGQVTLRVFRRKSQIASLLAPSFFPLQTSLLDSGDPKSFFC